MAEKKKKTSNAEPAPKTQKGGAAKGAKAKKDAQLADVLGISSEERENMLRAAVTHYGEGDFVRAETILVGLAAMHDSDARPVKLLASTLLYRGRERDAEAMYERAVKLDPDDPYVLVALADLKLKALKIKEAVALFDRLFALDPEGKHPAANRGRQIVQAYYAKLGGKG